MPTCCAPGCNRTEKTDPAISMFTLPKAKAQKNVWLHALSLVNKPAKTARVCQHHFERKFLVVDPKYAIAPHLYANTRHRITLTTDAYPTIFSHSSGMTRPRETSENRATKRQRKEILEECLSANIPSHHQGEANAEPSESLSGSAPASTSTCAEQQPTADNGSMDMCICRCRCSRCTITKLVSVKTQTDWPTRVKAVQVKPSTTVKSTSCEVTTRECSTQITTLTVDSETSTEESLDVTSEESDDDNTESDEDYYPSDDTSGPDSPVKALQQQHIPDIPADDQQKYLVFECNLMELFQRCPECGAGKLHSVSTLSGTLLRISYKCIKGHRGTWLSQPLLNSRMGAGNLLVSAAILCTGSSFQKVRELFEVLRLCFISENYFYELQNTHLFPVVNTMFTRQKEALIAAYGADPVTLVGDGRCDSPGYSAKYGTYTLMDEKSGVILTFALKQLGVSTSSVAMEKDGCVESLSELCDHDLNIEVLGTDCCRSVAKVLRERFPNVIHEHDVYHIQKRISKKITKKANQRGYHELYSWVKAVTNHLWWAAQNCNKNTVLLREMWLSLTSHVVGQHEWTFFKAYHKCSHGDYTPEVERNKKWLKVGSDTYKALCTIVRDRVLVKDIEKLTRAVHTGQLESYHSVLLKYCPKRQHFSYKGMVARTELAVLDHNFNIGRQQATTEAGTPRYHTVFPKRTKEWVAKPIRECKSHAWRQDLLKMVLKYKSGELEDILHIVVPDEVPQNIACTPKPPKDQIVKKQISRFADSAGQPPI